MNANMNMKYEYNNYGFFVTSQKEKRSTAIEFFQKFSKSLCENISTVLLIKKNFFWKGSGFKT